MSKIHYFQRYSSRENVVTNNTLQLLERMYSYSPVKVSQFLTELTGEAIEIGIEINQQQRGPRGIPDGQIVQRSLKILIESKVDGEPDVNQLLRHSKSFYADGQNILLLLTREALGRSKEEEIGRLVSKGKHPVVFKSITYEGICRAAQPLFREFEYEMRSLVSDYEEFCNEMSLFDQSRYLMRIVPCGVTFELNKKHGVYFRPKDQGYTNHRFLGVYTRKSVQVIWEVESVFDAEWRNGKLVKECVDGRDTDDYDESIVGIIRETKKECGFDVSAGHRFFCGIPVETDFSKSSWGGIQGPRFVNLRDFVEGSSEEWNASEVAAELRGKQWE